MPLSIQAMKERLTQLCGELSRGNTAICDTLFATDSTSRGGTIFPNLPGPAEPAQEYATYCAAFPDLRWCVDDMVAEGDRCLLRTTLSGTHQNPLPGIAPASGKRTTWTEMTVFRFNDSGKIQSRWREMDSLGLLQRLGVLPAPPGPSFPTPVPPAVTAWYAPSPADNKNLFRRFIETVWNQDQLDLAATMFHPGATSPSAPQLPAGADGVKIIVTLFRSAFSDFHMEIEDILAERDRVAACFSETGTHQGMFMNIAPTGQRVHFTEIGLLRIVNSQIVESWYEVDMLGLLRQLGVRS